MKIVPSEFSNSAWNYCIFAKEIAYKNHQQNVDSDNLFLALIKQDDLTKKILKIAIKHGGSSIKNFSNEDGKKGDFQQHFNVYGRKGEKCSNIDCNENVTKVVISNRATFFCKRCQK